MRIGKSGKVEKWQGCKVAGGNNLFSGFLHFVFSILGGAAQSGFAALLVALLVVGCNRDVQPTPTPQPIVNETPVAVSNVTVSNETVANTPTVQPTPVPRGRIVLWHSWAERDGDALAAILDGFAAEYPTITVDTLFVAYNDLPQSYADAVLAGGGPDVMMTANWWLNDLVAVNVVQPLDQLVSTEQMAEYWPAALDKLRRDYKLLGLPTNFETVSLFYNKSLIDPVNLPKSTAELAKVVALSETQGIGLYANLYHLAWGFPAYGAQIFDKVGTVTLDQSSGTAQFLGWLETIHNTPGNFVDIDYGMLLDRYKKQEFAFFVDGPWAIGELKAAIGDNLAVTTLPAGPSGPAQPWLSADGVFLNPKANPEQQALALLFARYLTSAVSGSTLAQIAQRLPANRGAQIDDLLLAGFIRQAEQAVAIETRPEMENVWGYGGDMISKVLNDVSEPADAVREAAALINEENGK